MSRSQKEARSEGNILVRRNTRGTTFGIRYRVNGERIYETIGTSASGTTMGDAERALKDRLAEVRLRTWRHPREAVEPETTTTPTLHELASDFLRLKGIQVTVSDDGQPVVDAGRSGLAATSAETLYRDVAKAIRFFADRAGESWAVDRIRPEDVDRFLLAHLDAGLKRATVRKLGQRVVALLDLAVEREHVARNAALGPVRRVKPEKPRPAALEDPEQIAALLAGASRLDARRANGIAHHRAFIAVLLFTGCRIAEACALRWRHLDLPASAVTIPGTKTEKARDRSIDLLPPLRDELLALKAARMPDAKDPILPTSAGTSQRPDNARARWWRDTVTEANAILTEANADPIPTTGPGKITPHSCRRSYISAMAVLGVDPATIMTSVGHTSPAMTFGVYYRAMRRRDGGLRRLAEVYGGGPSVTALPRADGALA